MMEDALDRTNGVTLKMTAMMGKMKKIVAHVRCHFRSGFIGHIFNHVLMW